MKWIKTGCLTLLSILVFFVLSWTAAYIHYNSNREKIQLDEEDIVALKKCNDKLLLHWEELISVKKAKFNNKSYLTRDEFFSVLDGIGDFHEVIEYLEYSIPDTESISFCGDEGLSYELYSICEVYPFFPDCYRHYVSVGKKDMCPWLISYENEIVLKENITGIVYYTISRNYWD